MLAICGGTLPVWCRELVLSCKFLFPFELRRRYFHCTSFGIGRALQHLQSLQTAEGGSTNHNSGHHDRDSREVRLGRLARQKVGSDAIALTALCHPACKMPVAPTQNGKQYIVTKGMPKCWDSGHL